MTILPLAQACKAAAQDFRARHEDLSASLAERYRAHRLRPNARLDIESALFIFWSLEIGLRNAHTWWFDRFLAETRFEALVRCGLDHPVAKEIAAGPGMDAFYRDRFRDALRTTRTICVTWDDDGRLHAPLTARTTKLFLTRTSNAGELVSPEAQQDVHARLVEECRTHILAMLSPGA